MRFLLYVITGNTNMDPRTKIEIADYIRLGWAGILAIILIILILL